MSRASEFVRRRSISLAGLSFPLISSHFPLNMTNRYHPVQWESASNDRSASATLANPSSYPRQTKEGNGKFERGVVDAKRSFEAGSVGVYTKPVLEQKQMLSSRLLASQSTINNDVLTKNPFQTKESSGSKRVVDTARADENVTLKVSGTDRYGSLRSISDALESRDVIPVTPTSVERREPCLSESRNDSNVALVTPTNVVRPAVSLEMLHRNVATLGNTVSKASHGDWLETEDEDKLSPLKTFKRSRFNVVPVTPTSVGTLVLLGMFHRNVATLENTVSVSHDNRYRTPQRKSKIILGSEDEDKLSPLVETFERYKRKARDKKSQRRRPKNASQDRVTTQIAKPVHSGKASLKSPEILLPSKRTKAKARRVRFAKAVRFAVRFRSTRVEV